MSGWEMIAADCYSAFTPQKWDAQRCAELLAHNHLREGIWNSYIQVPFTQNELAIHEHTEC